MLCGDYTTEYFSSMACYNVLSSGLALALKRDKSGGYFGEYTYTNHVALCVHSRGSSLIFWSFYDK